MRRTVQLPIIIVFTLTLSTMACDSGNGGGTEDPMPDVLSSDQWDEEVGQEDLVEEDLPPGMDLVEDLAGDGSLDVPSPDCVEDADCDDGDLCNGVEYCLDSVCIPGDAVDCGVVGPCHESIECVPDTGECVPSFLEMGTGCDDGLVCNGLANCDGAGLCVPGDNVVVCGYAETCQEPDGTCACLSPNWVEDEACVGPALTATFDDVDLGESGAWTGGGEDVVVRSGNAVLHNNYDPEFMTWDGFAVSEHTDSETPGYMNDLSAITGGGVHGSAAYAVGYESGFAPSPPTLEVLDAGEGVVLKGIYVTNTTYAYLSMLEGDDYAKKFGGDDGTDEDWFLLTIHGVDAGGAETGMVTVYLADFRAPESADDYILDEWTWVDLGFLGPVKGLRFTLTSSDVGEWGMNTPAYFALDDLNRLEPVAGFHDLGLGAEASWDGADMSGGFQSGNLRFLNNYNPEWMVWDGFAASTVTDNETPGVDNMFSAAPGSGDADAAYAIGYDGSGYGNPLPTIEVVGGPAAFESLSLTNTTYAWLSMLDGDDFAKKFGGEDGTEEDWFLLTIEGLDGAGEVAGVVEHYLADLRFDGASEDDYLLSTWDSVVLGGLGSVSGLRFSLTSSDMGEFGMNTPSYFALDAVTLQD